MNSPHTAPDETAIPLAPDAGESAADFVGRVEAAGLHERTRSGRGELAWRIWGEGAPLVLLHGGSGSWRHWIRNLAALGGSYRLMVPDLPGLGDSSDPPAPFDWRDLRGSTAALAAVVQEGIDVLLPRGEPYRLAGFSLGSIVGAYVAAGHRDRVRSLILVGASALGMPWRGLTGELRPIDAHMTREEQLDAQRHNLKLVMLAREESVDDLALHVQLENVRRARMRTHALAGSDVLRRVLPEFEAPLGALWGTADVYALPDLDARESLIRHHHPSLLCRTIPGGGHWVMYERAATFNRTVLEMLDALDAG